MNTELLLAVKAAILANPKTYDQGEWCGTAQCIAGHGVAIAFPLEYAEACRENPDAYEFVCNRKNEAFAIDSYQAERLFYSEEWPEQFPLKSRFSAHARAMLAAARIDHFIATGGAE